MTMPPRSPQLSATHHEHLVRPQHTNAHNTVFGGEVMAWVDIAAATCAMRHCSKAVVTASIDSLHFLAPVPMGWLVALDAVVNYTSRTSCEIEVTVTGKNPVTGESHHTASAYLTFVALDSNGRPAQIPQVAPGSDQERARFAAGKERRDARLAAKKQLLQQSGNEN